MSFSDTYRNIALSPELVPVLFPALAEQYAEEFPTGSGQYTIGLHWDDADHTLKRYAGFDNGTVVPIVLSDGRACYRVLFQSALEAEFLANGLLGVDELTDEQVFALLPPFSQMP